MTDKGLISTRRSIILSQVSKSLTDLHTFSLSGLGCADLVEIYQASQLPELYEQDQQQKLVLGGGSNIIFIEDFQGLVVRNQIQGIVVEETADYFLVSAGAGVNWHQFVGWCLERGIFGLENLALIPGTVGAAPVQNIGAYGVELEKVCSQVDYFDIESRTFKSLTNQACEFGYRDSIFKNALKDKAVITQVHFKLSKRWQSEQSYGPLGELQNPSAQDIYENVMEIRSAKLPDPEIYGNAGSFFKNPVIKKSQYEQLRTAFPQIPGFEVNENEVKVPAAWLIDQAGLKGKQIGGVQCNPLQPLVLMNTGEGTAEELIRLAKLVIETVKKAFGVILHPEVRLIGRSGEVELSHV